MTDVAEYAPNEHDTLTTALLHAQRAIGGIPKTETAKVKGINKKTGKPYEYEYKFVSVEQVMAAAKLALNEEGLAWSVSGWALADVLGKPCLSATFVLDHPKSTTSRSYTFVMPLSTSQDTDKAVAGALSNCDREALRMLLQIPRPDPNEPDRRTADHGDRWESVPRSTQRRGQASQQRKAASDPAVGALRKEVRALAERYKKETGATFDDVCKDAFNGKTLAGIPTKAELETLKVFLQAANASIDGREIIYDQQEAAQETFGDDQPGF